jgi:hypothetical protein
LASVAQKFHHVVYAWFLSRIAIVIETASSSVFVASIIATPHDNNNDSDGRGRDTPTTTTRTSGVVDHDATTDTPQCRNDTGWTHSSHGCLETTHLNVPFSWVFHFCHCIHVVVLLLIEILYFYFLWNESPKCCLGIGPGRISMLQGSECLCE